MKRNTLILLLIALVLGVAVYYLEYKPGKPRDEEPSASKPAWEIKREDIASLELKRGGQTMVFALEGEKWMIKQPLSASANESAISSLLSDLTAAQVEREFAASAEDLRGYGLESPTVRVEMKLKNGQSKVIELGAKDPLGSSAYARIGGGANVAMVSASLLTSADKSLNDFRDRTLFGGAQTDLTQAKFVNESGSFELAKKDEVWNIQRPVQAEADESEVSTLLAGIISAEATEIVSETDAEAAKYGLDKPKVSFTGKLTGGTERVVSLGSKIEEDYYAKVSDKPQIFKVNASFYDKLNTRLIKLKSKTIVKFNRDEMTSVQIKNPNLTVVAERNAEGKWLIKQPAEKKDQEASTFKLLDPLETRATEIVEKPDAAIAKLLAAPKVEARLTGKDGKVTVIKISAAKDGDAYVRVEGRPEIYKVNQSMVDSLSFKLDEIISTP